MGLFNETNPKEKKHKGILGAFAVDVIKWEPETDEEASIIVHKFEYEDFPDGSYLIVDASQMAVFTNNIEAGNSLDADGIGQSQVSVFVGPCKIKLETGDSRFAPFRSISHALTGGESAFHSKVYFINTTYMTELNWGTQAPIVVEDPEEEVNVHVRAFGLFGAHIEQSDISVSQIQARRFLTKVVGTRADYTREELIGFMRAKILEYVPNLLAQNMIERKIGILKISGYLSEFSEVIYNKLIEHFAEFGLVLDNFSFHNINAPDEDLRALNEMKIKRKRDQFEAEGAAKKMDIESEARARMREREGYTYQQEAAFKTMQAAASNEGTAGNIMGAGMGLGMGFGIGGAFGSGMGNIAQGTMDSTNMMQAGGPSAQAACPACGTANPMGAKFCANCGGSMIRVSRCPNCGKEAVPGAKFCLECGTSLARPGVCPSCGKEVAPGAKFCLECGTKL